MNKDNIWSVYIHTVPKNISGYEYDKNYVGITSRNPNERWGKNGYGYKGKPFYNAILKYGWNNMLHKIIYTNLTEEQAKKIEIKLIKELDSYIDNKGYNATLGGDGQCKYTPEQFKEWQELYDNGYSPEEISKKFNIPGITIRNHIQRNEKMQKIIQEKNANKLRRPVAQYDLNGKFIQIFSSEKEVMRHYNTKNTIHAAAQGKVKCALGYMWRYIDNDKEIPQQIEPYQYTGIINPIGVDKYDLNGNFIKHYDNLTAAEKDGDFSRKSIKRHMDNNTPYKNFLWKYS